MVYSFEIILGISNRLSLAFTRLSVRIYKTAKKWLTATCCMNTLCSAMNFAYIIMHVIKVKHADLSGVCFTGMNTDKAQGVVYSATVLCNAT